VLAEPPVTWVDKNTERHRTTQTAQEYLKYLYTAAGQEIIARNFYRPRDKTVAAKYSKQFPNLPLFTVDEQFGGWTATQKKYFDDGGVFDQIYAPGR
jgi:ABC-type sulfate transport system substrate-binding protein